MRGGPRLEPIIVTTEENHRLVEWTRRHKTSQALALRARIVLACQQDRSNREIAKRLQVTVQTVGKWRQRFVARRLDGLLDEPRPGAPRTISDAVVEKVLAKTLHDKPRDATHWSSRTMAKASGLSQTAVVRIWRAFGCVGSATSGQKGSGKMRDFEVLGEPCRESEVNEQAGISTIHSGTEVGDPA